MNALDVTGITAGYGQGIAVDHITACVPKGAMCAIIGPNGAGKSTLLKAMLGLVPATGETRFFGQPLRQARKQLAYVPQRASVDWDFPVRAIDVVMQGLYPALGFWRPVRPYHRKTALECLNAMGMGDYAKRQIGALSGGQQQRVFLARALAQKADLYMLDEPFAGVDAATESAVIKVLHQLRESGKTIICVHHDLSTVPEYFDHVILLNRTLVAYGPCAATFTQANLTSTYGGHLPVFSG